MKPAFVEKLANSQAGRSNFALYVAPRIDKMPPAFQRHDDPFLPYLRSVYAATEGLVCAYVFHLASYLALGAAGTIALERSIALATPTHITILDAGFSSDDFARVWDEAAFGCDSVTITPEVPLLAYQTRTDRQAFTVTDIANRRLVVKHLTITLLPLDTLDRSRSLTFEETLRDVVRENVLR